MESLRDRVALVAGGADALGREIAEGLLRAGAETVLFDGDRRALESAQESCGEAGRELRIRRGRAADEEQAAELFTWIGSTWGRLDFLVCAFEAPSISRVAETSLGAFSSHLEARTAPVFLLCREAGRQMAASRSRGRIVNLVGVLERPGLSYACAYEAGEAAVTGFSRELARELAPHRVAVNCLRIGAADTPAYRERALGAWARLDGVSRTEERRRILEALPERRLVSPREIADAVLALCSDGGAAMTAQVLNLGGLR